MHRVEEHMKTIADDDEPEMAVLLGNNGTGKSFLLNLLLMRQMPAQYSSDSSIKYSQSIKNSEALQDILKTFKEDDASDVKSNLEQAENTQKVKEVLIKYGIFLRNGIGDGQAKKNRQLEKYYSCIANFWEGGQNVMFLLL